MKNTSTPPDAQQGSPREPEPDARPRYQPPRLTKKKSVSRMTLSFGGATGIPAAGIPGVP